MLQDEDKRSQLHRNFCYRSLLFTKEYIDAGFGILDAGTNLSATIVTGSHVLKKIGVPGFFIARSWVCKVLVLYTYVLSAGPNKYDSSCRIILV